MQSHQAQWQADGYLRESQAQAKAGLILSLLRVEK
jgi:hypothetical protein